MKERIASILAGLLAACVGASCLVWWFRTASMPQVLSRIDPNRSAVLETSSGAVVRIEGQFQAYDGKPSSVTSSWSRFRGELSDNISREPVALADQWPSGGPPALWTVRLGEGYAGAAVHGGRVYVLDYDAEREGDALRCFSLDDGREIWRRWYKVRIKRNHGMSRTVPAVTERCVVSIGPKCHVLCADPATGAFKWGLDLCKDFGATVPMWYTGQCPLIDGTTVVLAPGGAALLIGVDCETGKVLWQTPNPQGWKMSHASVQPMTLNGRRMYVYCAIGGMAGVAADGADVGKLLWETADWNYAVVSPSPVPLQDGRVFVTAGYGVGSRMFQVAEAAGAFAVKSLFVLDRKVFACEQHTPVLYDGKLFAVLPNDAGALRQQLVCLNTDGKPAWNSGEGNRFGLGPFVVADGKIFVLSDEGMLTMARASGESFKLLGQAKILPGPEAWAPLAVAGGFMVARDRDRMVCVDLRRK
jgi:outer membrane protein assembly factor BamB